MQNQVFEVLVGEQLSERIANRVGFLFKYLDVDFMIVWHIDLFLLYP